jgi:drug/metabolite transporter (DMT)-like permease
MNNALLYVLTVVIWGSTWVAIKFQLGAVSPLVSIAHRFALAALLIFVYLLLRRQSVRLSLRDHGFAFVQGLFLFCANYVCVYEATATLTSGLVAVVFSTMVILNMLSSAVFLSVPLNAVVGLGGGIGLLGMVGVFMPELQAVDMGDATVRAILICFLGTCFASLGNVVAARNQRQQLPVLVCNGWGMVYGAGTLYIVALLLGQPITVDWVAPYVLSLIYLSVFGSMVAFWAYVTLIGRIGADRAAYTTLLFPVVALLISTAVEGYQWTWLAFAGLALVLGGNWLVMRRGSA